MILTVTFNPAIDKTAEVDELIPGGLNRLRNVMQDAGGRASMYPKPYMLCREKVLRQDFWQAQPVNISGRF